MDRLRAIEREGLRTNLPAFDPGDTVRVMVRVREIAFWEARGGGEGLVAGLDEAGRGPLAGPVVAAAVVFPPFCKIIRGLRDSKMLSAPKRARLAAVIRARALAVAVGAASVREIDRLNIRRASILAMRRALARLAVQPAHIAPPVSIPFGTPPAAAYSGYRAPPVPPAAPDPPRTS